MQAAGGGEAPAAPRAAGPAARRAGPAATSQRRSRPAAPRPRPPRARPCRRRRRRSSCRSSAAAAPGRSAGASTSTVFAARSAGGAPRPSGAGPRRGRSRARAPRRARACASSPRPASPPIRISSGSSTATWSRSLRPPGSRSDLDRRGRVRRRLERVVVPLTRRSVAAASRHTFVTVPSQTERRPRIRSPWGGGRGTFYPARRSGRADRGSTLAAVKVLIVGSGGREHALAWKLASSPQLDELHAAPGNPGIARLGQCHPVRAEDGEGLLSLCRELAIDLVVVGPEAPLVVGLADTLRRGGRRRVRADAGRGADRGVEGLREGRAGGGRRSDRRSASPSRGRPASSRSTGSRPARASSSAARRTSSTPACAAPRRSAASSLIEELLEGEEVSLFALSDGERGGRPRAGPGLQARRRAGHRPEHRRDGRVLAGAGPRRAEVEELLETVHRPVLAELARRDAPFTGLLYAGPDADRGRPAGARVQLPLRRSRDAGDPAADRGRPPAAARSARRPASWPARSRSATSRR